MAEDILETEAAVAGRRRGQTFAGFRVEPARSVPLGLVLFRRGVTFPLDGQGVQNLRPRQGAQVAQRPDQRHHVVAVHRPEITEVERFEQVALVQEKRLGPVQHLLDHPPHARHPVHGFPGRILEPVVMPRRADVQQRLFQGAHVGVDRDAVVVQHDQNIVVGIRSRVVQPFERQTARHFAVISSVGIIQR